ncbi:MAG: hypothetical protein AAF266_15070 [Planctomycetota bacterium]
MEAFIDWPVAARRVVEQSIDQHGGQSAWKVLTTLEISVLAFSGAVWKLKGAGKTFPVPTRFIVEPHTKRVTFPDYPEPGQITTYHSGRVSIEDGGSADGLVFDQANYRDLFAGLRRRLRKWSPTDVAYFIGYSMGNYHGYPFRLPYLRFVRQSTATIGGERRDRLVLAYPRGSDCHTEEQSFYFDPAGQLCRVDYSADIVGPGPAAAQYYEDYRDVSGVLFPHRRRVLGRVLGVLTRMNLVTVDLDIKAT